MGGVRRPVRADQLNDITMHKRIWKSKKLVGGLCIAVLLLCLGLLGWKAMQLDTQRQAEDIYFGSTLLSDSAKKQRAEQVISSFENGTTDIQYAYIANLQDGRGYTAGRAGFTTGTSDLLAVIRRYTALKPGNELARYLPALVTINGSDSLAGLDGFPAVWQRTANTDPLLRQVQDEFFDELYFTPAMARAKSAGVATPIGQLIILDTAVQHGIGNDPDGLPAIIDETIRHNGKAGKSVSEVVWLEKFLASRRQHLTNASNVATRQAWKESAPRIDALKMILDAGNYGLETPLRWKAFGTSYQL